MTPETITAIASTCIAAVSAIIAGCALFLTIKQARLAEKQLEHSIKHNNKMLDLTVQHSKLSVKPHLCTWVDETPNRYTAVLRNNGLGPAIIKSWEVRLDGQTVRGIGTAPLQAAFRKLLAKYNPEDQYGFLGPNFMLADKQEQPLLDLHFNKDKKPSSEEMWHQMFPRVAVIIDYESIYGDSFTLNTLDELKNQGIEIPENP